MKRSISEDASQVAQDLRSSGRLTSVQQMPNPYAVLGLAIGEPRADAIRRAFLRAVRSFPPQSHPMEFVCVVEAYEMLRDPVRRAAVESGLLEVPVAGKHRRLGSLTPQSAAAFLRARDGPVCALDQQGLCHPAGDAPHRDAAAASGSGTSGPAAAAAAAAAAASSPQGPGPERPPREDWEPPIERTVGVFRSQGVTGRHEPQWGEDMAESLGEEGLLRTESVGSAMHLEPLGRTASVSSAMSV
mmetsp:Transcript_82854/g.261715  ORF Transcript_82854/g.261715 Transcript_82854/m.261715 type:complete len:244 (+) Transcript_82854:110-841(+)